MKIGKLNKAISVVLIATAAGTGAFSTARAVTAGEGDKQSSEQSADRSGSDPEAVQLDTIHVTGTRIRGGVTPSPVLTIGIESIREEGFKDLGEVIRSIPQNFGGGQNPGVAAGASTGSGGLANQNITGGSSLNLRGLGPDATLTLLNGRRMTYGGFVQTVDISAIPVEAVARIEVVADGASAIYGSDAVAGVGNVILRRDYEGVQVGARYGDSADGGLGTREYTATAGATWSTGGFIAAFKDSTVDPIHADERDYTRQLRPPTTLYPGSDLRSGLLSLHQSIGESVDVRVDALRTHRDQRYANWPSAAVNYYHAFAPRTTAQLLSPTVEFHGPGEWTLWAGATWGRDEREQFETRVFPDADAVLRTNDCYCNESRAYEVGGEGPLLSMRGGEARVAVGAGYRSNDFLHANYLTGTTTTEGRDASRFAYAELSLPVIGPAMAVTGVRRLEATAALRSEDYDSFGRVTTPKLGLVYAPSADYTLKSSWGRSFKTPTLFQQHWDRQAVLYTAPTLGAVGAPAGATALMLGGGNPDLDPERARTLTASVAFHPVAAPNLEMELTWFDIDYTDRVVQPVTDYAQALRNPLYAQFVQRAPSAAELQAVIDSADAFYNVAGAPYVPGNVVALVRAEYVNVARQRIRGLDLSGSYRMDLGAGRLTLRGSGSWLDSSQQSAAGQANYALSGVLFNPAKVNARLGGVWAVGGLSASTFANYTGGVTNTADDEKTASFTTWDATLRYASDRPGAWSGLELSLSAQNLLNRAPPLHTTLNSLHAPFDSTNYSAIGRFVSVSVSKHF
ncbi:MAG: TonB-dependent receptor plug domain-containing protein [Luteimonas sp.]